MGSLTNYMENALVNLYFGGTAFSNPGTHYFALFTADPTESSSGTEVSTGSWTNYARIAVTNNTTNYGTDTSNGLKANAVAINFGTATTTGDINVSAIGAFDASSGGNLLFYHVFTNDVVVQNGNDVTVPVGDFDVDFSAA